MVVKRDLQQKFRGVVSFSLAKDYPLDMNKIDLVFALLGESHEQWLFLVFIWVMWLSLADISHFHLERCDLQGLFIGCIRYRKIRPGCSLILTSTSFSHEVFFCS